MQTGPRVMAAKCNTDRKYFASCNYVTKETLQLTIETAVPVRNVGTRESVSQPLTSQPSNRLGGLGDHFV